MHTGTANGGSGHPGRVRLIARGNDTLIVVEGHAGAILVPNVSPDEIEEDAHSLDS